MTRDEADAKVREAKDELSEASLDWWAHGGNEAKWNRFVAAARNYREAKSARAALDKPRLMTTRDRAFQIAGRHFGYTTRVMAEAAINEDRADILAQAEKLAVDGMIPLDAFRALMKGE